MIPMLLLLAGVADMAADQTLAARTTAVRFYECLMAPELPNACLALLDDPETFLGEPWTGRRGSPAAARAWTSLRANKAALDLGDLPKLIGGPVLLRYLVLDLGQRGVDNGPTVVLERRPDGKSHYVMLPLIPTGDEKLPYAVNITAIQIDGAFLATPAAHGK